MGTHFLDDVSWSLYILGSKDGFHQKNDFLALLPAFDKESYIFRLTAIFDNCIFSPDGHFRREIHLFFAGQPFLSRSLLFFRYLTANFTLIPFLTPYS